MTQRGDRAYFFSHKNHFSSISILIAISLFLVLMTPVKAQEHDSAAVQQELETLKQRVAALEKLLKLPRVAAAIANIAEEGNDSHTDTQVLASVASDGSEQQDKREATIGETTLTFGGQLRMDVVVNDPSGSSNFGMSASSIPSSTVQGEDWHTAMTLRDSRLWFKSTTPTKYGDFNTLIETDFWGSSGNETLSNSHNIRLRHAFAEFAGFTIGQTNSTFMHSGTAPDLIIIPVTDVFVRQPLLRYTQEFGDNEWQVALEQPETTFSDSTATQITPDDDRLPDLTGQVTWRPEWGQFSISGVLRHLHIDTGDTALGAVPAGVSDQAFGGGIFASSRIDLQGANNIRLGYIIGNGLGRYIANNSFNAATVDNAGKIHLQNSMAAFAAYQHWWSDNWHSSFAMTHAQVDNDLGILSDTAFKDIQSYHANLRWAPLENATMGFEYGHARSEKENGEKGRLHRFQFSTIYNF